MIAPVERAADARPVAYIRRSVVSRSAPGDTSRDVQIDAVRELAGDDGDRLVVLDGDWGRSASRHESESRTAFREMLASIERGEVSAVYAYATDRLARDVEAAARLLNLCERAGVPIITREGRYQPGDRMARGSFHLAALMNEDYSSNAAGKQADVVASRRRRGDKLGPPPYGMRIAPHAKGEAIRWERDPDRDPALVLAVYRETGSFRRSAQLLNERGVPAPVGSRWYSGSVGRVLHREYANEFDVRNVEPRVKHGGSDALFRRLLVCHCGGMLTPTRQRDGSISYRCNKGYVEPVLSFEGNRHRSVRAGNPDGITIPERIVRVWAIEEAAKWDQLIIERRAAAGPAVDVAALDERRRLAGIAFTKGALTEAELDAELAEIDAERRRAADQADAKRYLRLRRGVDWNAPPQDIAAACKRLWSAIHLGPDIRSTHADWRVAPPG